MYLDIDMCTYMIYVYMCIVYLFWGQKYIDMTCFGLFGAPGQGSNYPNIIRCGFRISCRSFVLRFAYLGTESLRVSDLYMDT